MHYQVVARLHMPAGAWEYYPYWSPVRDKHAATRLATYAAQSGYEVAILQSVTADMLQHIARNVVEQQDTRLLPPSRYLPGARIATASGWREQGVNMEVQRLEGGRRDVEELNLEGPNKVVLDALRLGLEEGPGGDVTLRAGWQPQQISFPRRMDVLRAWMRLRRQLLQGQIGNVLGGALEDASDD
jgi:hypothetical protein